MSEEVPDNPKEHSIEELIALFGDTQTGFTEAVTLVSQIPDNIEREKKIKELKIVAERKGLHFPTEADIQKKLAEFVAEGTSLN